jgi:hypothetical protein
LRFSRRWRFKSRSELWHFVVLYGRISYRILPQHYMVSQRRLRFEQCLCPQYGVRKHVLPFCVCFPLTGKSRDSSVGIALVYGLDDRRSRVRFPAGAGNFSLHHRDQTGSGAHPASYPMGTGGFFPWGKAAGAWSWPLTTI